MARKKSRLGRSLSDLIAVEVVRSLSWTPRRRGKLYCAPACGRGCTRAMYERAKREATTLVKVLGPGWKIRVWENLGWYGSAVCGDIEVGIRENNAFHRDEPYFALISPGSHHTVANTALGAVRKMLFNIQVQRRAIEAMENQVANSISSKIR